MPTPPTVRTVARGTGNILQDRRVVDMADTLNLLEPSAAPLIRFTGSSDNPKALIKKQKCINPEFQWIEDQLLPGLDRVNNAAGYAAGATSIVVDNGGYFRINDIVHVPRTNETLRVTNVVGNTLTVTRSWGAQPAAALVDNDEFIILGTAMEENSTSVGIRSTLEVRQRNYCQIFRRTWSLTNTEMASELYGGKDRPYQQKKQGIEHAKSLEYAFMFGERVEDTSGTHPRRTTGGLREYITQNVTNLGGGLLTEPTWEQWLRTGFRYATNGSKASKVVVCSALVMSAISSWARGKLMLNPKTEEYGINIMTYLSPHGRVHLVRHWLLEGDEYNGWAFLLDMGNLKYRFLSGRDTKLWTNTQENNLDGVQDEYLSEVGFQIEWDDTHSILRGVAGY